MMVAPFDENQKFSQPDFKHFIGFQKSFLPKLKTK